MKTLDLSKAGEELNQFEDPLVCSLCGTPEITCLDSIGNTCYCTKCGEWRNILDKSLRVEPITKTIQHWRTLTEQSSETQLNKKQEESLRESIYAKQRHDQPQKYAELVNIAEDLGYEVHPR